MARKNEHGLTDQQEHFARLVAEGKLLIEAYQEAYPKSRDWKRQSLHASASNLAANELVTRRIYALRNQAVEKTEVNIQRLVREMAAVAFADPRELVEIKVGCCRHCWGEGHKYQRTVAEMNMDRELWAIKGNNAADFDEQGGIGFDPLKAPHPSCPDCGGDGHARTVLKDTRKLSAEAAALFAGAKTTKYGIEVQMHSKMDAMEKIARFLGAYEKDNEQKTSTIAAILAGLSGNVVGPVPAGKEPQPQGEDDDDDDQ